MKTNVFFQSLLVGLIFFGSNVVAMADNTFGTSCTDGNWTIDKFLWGESSKYLTTITLTDNFKCPAASGCWTEYAPQETAYSTRIFSAESTSSIPQYGYIGFHRPMIVPAGVMYKISYTFKICAKNNAYYCSELDYELFHFGSELGSKDTDLTLQSGFNNRTKSSVEYTKYVNYVNADASKNRWASNSLTSTIVYDNTAGKEALEINDNWGLFFHVDNGIANNKKVDQSHQFVLQCSSFVSEIVPEGDALRPYKITTAAELESFRDVVNNGNRTACAVLSNDIDLGGTEWKMPIGWYKSSSQDGSYKGTFDGQGHTISNVNVDYEEGHDAGLFGRVEPNGVIKNLIVANATIKGSWHVGAIVGENNGGQIRNCAATGNLSLSGNKGDENCIGGICGECHSGRLDFCFANYDPACAVKPNNSFTNLFNNDSRTASGEVCYWMNQEGSGTWTWYQQIGIDQFPTTFSKNPEESTVYLYKHNGNDFYMSRNGIYNNSLFIKDGYSYTIGVPFTALAVDYAREMSNTWGTMTLPFSFDYSAENDLYRLYYLDEVRSNSLIFAPYESGTIEAGTPVAIKKLVDGPANIKIGATNSNLTPTSKVMECGTTGWSMKGDFAMHTSTDGNQYDPYSFDLGMDVYCISQNKFWHVNSKINMPAFRAYFVVPQNQASAVRSFGISEEAGQETSIQITEDEVTGAVQMTYDLNGRRASAQRGLSVKNGKCVMIK